MSIGTEARKTDNICAYNASQGSTPTRSKTGKHQSHRSIMDVNLLLEPKVSHTQSFAQSSCSIRPAPHGSGPVLGKQLLPLGAQLYGHATLFPTKLLIKRLWVHISPSAPPCEWPCDSRMSGHMYQGRHHVVSVQCRQIHGRHRA
jgi:hypothetical protein